MAEMLRTEQVLEALESAVIATDTQGVVQRWNAAAERLFGWSAAEAVGRFILDLTPSISEGDVRSEVLAAVQAGSRWRGDYAVRRRDGTTFLAHVTLGPIRDETGRAVGFLGTAADVTRRRFAEIASGVAYGGSPAEVMDVLAQAVVTTTGLAGCVIAIWGEDGQGLHITGCCGVPPPYAQRFLSEVAADDAHPAVQAYLSLRTTVSEGSFEGPPDGANGADSFGERFGPHNRELWVPLVVRNRPVGVMGAFVNSENTPDDVALRLVNRIAAPLAAAVDSALLFAAAQEDATLRERRRVSRDLHDSLGQTLYSITLLARAAQLSHARSAGDESAHGDTVSAALDDLRSLSQSALAEARALITGLRPSAQEGGDLIAQLERRAKVMTAQSGVPVTVTGPPDGLVLLPQAEEHLGRIAREALTNVAKHASATQVTVRVSVADEVVLEVTDDGCGFEPNHRKPGRFGLETMRERTRLLGGHLDIESRPGDGCTVRARCPLSVLTGEEKA